MPRGPRLLLVEDDAALRRSLRLQLRDEGFGVLEAATGGEAHHHLAARPDAVLLDLGLPDVDGVGLCAAIRSVTGVPVVVVSGRSWPGDVPCCLAAGADDHLAKPFSAVSLARRVRILLRPPRPLPAALLGGGLADVLTHTELRLLSELAAEPRRTVPCSALLDAVWGLPTGGHGDRVDARIDSLRDKLVLARCPVAVAASADGYRLQP